mgnify:CR=1 FL=1|jgi:desulfoferrodoxin (superoxide reductase-like protein)
MLKNYLKTNDQGKEKHVPNINVRECVACGKTA